MLSTLAMFVTGVAVLYFGRRRGKSDAMEVDPVVLTHDMRTFAIAYAIAIGAAFLPVEPVWLKWLVAVGLIAIYARYVKQHFDADRVPVGDGNGDDLAPLRFRPGRSVRPPASTRPCPGCASSTSRSSPPWP